MSCDEPPPPALLEGIAQFNRGEFFEQHETLELLWRVSGFPPPLGPFSAELRRGQAEALCAKVGSRTE